MEVHFSAIGCVSTEAQIIAEDGDGCRLRKFPDKIADGCDRRKAGADDNNIINQAFVPSLAA